MNNVSNQLEKYVHYAADNFKNYWDSLQDVDDYAAFLSMVHFFSQGGRIRLQCALKISYERDLKEYFEHEYEEEKDHPEIALKDLSALNKNLSFEEPIEVSLANDLWEKMAKYNVNYYLGSQYVLENMSQHVEEKALSTLNRLNIPESGRTFVLAHLDLDGGNYGHGASAKRICEKYFNKHPASCLRGGYLAAHAWISVLNGVRILQECKANHESSKLDVVN